MSLKSKNKKMMKLNKEYSEKYLKDSLQDKTAKIDLSQFNMNKNEDELLYEKFASLSLKELDYHLHSGDLSKKEISIIKKIINERK